MRKTNKQTKPFVLFKLFSFSAKFVIEKLKDEGNLHLHMKKITKWETDVGAQKKNEERRKKSYS